MNDYFVPRDEFDKLMKKYDCLARDVQTLRRRHADEKRRIDLEKTELEQEVVRLKCELANLRSREDYHILANQTASQECDTLRSQMEESQRKQQQEKQRRSLVGPLLANLRSRDHCHMLANQNISQKCDTLCSQVEKSQRKLQEKQRRSLVGPLSLGTITGLAVPHTPQPIASRWFRKGLATTTVNAKTRSEPWAIEQGASTQQEGSDSNVNDPTVERTSFRSV